MYAQVFELDAEQGERLNGSICELLRALRTEDGFCGGLSLVLRETGEMILLVFWETENEATHPLLPAGVTAKIWEVSARA